MNEAEKQEFAAKERQIDELREVNRKLTEDHFRCHQLQKENMQLKSEIYDLTKWPKQFPVVVSVYRGLADIVAKPAGVRVVVIDCDDEGHEVDGPYISEDLCAERFMLPDQEVAKIIEEHDKE